MEKDELVFDNEIGDIIENENWLIVWSLWIVVLSTIMFFHSFFHFALLINNNYVQSISICSKWKKITFFEFNTLYFCHMPNSNTIENWNDHQKRNINVTFISIFCWWKFIFNSTFLLFLCVLYILFSTKPHAHQNLFMTKTWSKNILMENLWKLYKRLPDNGTQSSFRNNKKE